MTTGWGDVDISAAEHVCRINATDEGDEPVGEYVEVTMPRVAGLIERQGKALNDIRALHVEVPCTVPCKNPRGLCVRCQTHMPCSTISILDRLGV
ncbi:hypothetical protein PP713_13925 [Mycobacterium sp. CSUR Q5927]|nr:hypothetical protein [Mycobacterium sp. CSUR Q5927]